MHQEPWIKRTNHVRALTTTLRGPFDLVFVDGPPGVGVTTLMQQLAVEVQPSVSLFLRNGTRIGYDPKLVICRLVDGLTEALGDSERPQTFSESVAVLPTLLNKVGRRAIHKFSVTFVLDGLHQIPASDAAVRDEIVEFLPMGQPGCTFVVAGTAAQFSGKVTRRLLCTSHTLTGFTLDEAKTFLADYPMEASAVERVWNDAGCNPSVLASVRRLLDAGARPEELSRRLSDDPSSIFMAEWERADLSQQAKRLLAIVAFDEGEYSRLELAALGEQSEEDVDRTLGALRFMNVPSEGPVAFVSPFFREFARKQLAGLRAIALETVIGRYQKAPDSVEALVSLPQYLSQQGRPAELLQYLSPARFPSVVRASGSASVIHQATTDAAAAARGLQNYADLVRFSVHAATLASLHATQPSDSEVRALLALGKVEDARLVAESATMAEDRLQLLAKIGRDLSERGMVPDQRLVSMIEKLCGEVELSLFGERGMDLAEDLLFVSPALGLDLLDKVAQRRRSDEQSSWAFADLAVEATRWSKRSLFPTASIADLHARITDPEAKLTAACRATTYAQSSGAQILAEARNLPRVADGLRLLGSWVAANRLHQDALAVVQEGLLWMTSSLDLVPNARVLRQLASALPEKTDPELSSIVASFDALARVPSTIGPSSEYVRLQGALAHAEWEYNRQEASSRLLNAAIYASELVDPSMRATSFASLARRLTAMDPEHVLDVSDNLHELALGEARRAIAETLRSTAEPHITLAGALASLAQSHIDLAIETVETFNSVDRTDAGLLQLALSLGGERKNDLAISTQILERLSTHELRDIALVLPLSGFQEREQLSPEERASVSKLMSLLRNGSYHPLTLTRGVRVAQKHCPEERDALVGRVVHWADTCEKTSDNVDVYFEVSAMLADAVPEASAEFLRRAAQLKRELVFSNPLRSETYQLIVSLAAKALIGLFKGQRDTPEQMQEVAQIVEGLPTRLSRVRVWTRLALGLAEQRRFDDCRRLRDDQLRRLLEDARRAGDEQYAMAMIEAAPALFACHSSSALEQIRGLPASRRDRAVHAIAHYVLHGLPPNEPCSPPLDGVYDLSYEDIVDLISLAEVVERDGTAFQFLKAACSSMASTRFRQYSREQKAQIASRVRGIAAAKFPTPRYVRHNGYGIVSKAQALQLVHSEAADWNALADEARVVDNVADVPLILMMIATCVPSKFGRIKEILFKDARDRVDSLQSIHDRAQRLVDLAHFLRSSDRSSARAVLKTAVALFNSSKESMTPPSRLVDAVHRIDPEAADLLVAMKDDDPARSGVRKRLRGEFETLKLAAAIHDMDDEALGREATGEAAWLALADLNADQGTPLAGPNIWRLVENAARHPLQVSFPILSLAFSSAAKRFSGTEHSAALLRSIFDGVVTAAKVVHEMSSDGRERRRLQTGAQESAVLVRVGERAMALEWLDDWCGKHVTEQVVVCDPYFGPKDLECVKLLAKAAPNVRIRIITSRKALESIRQPWEQSFRDHWRQNLSSADPPDVEVLVVGVGSQGKSPIHDRWWLATNAGLRLGTSFNGLGIRESEISALTEKQHVEVTDLLAFYLRRERNWSSDARIEYSMFSL